MQLAYAKTLEESVLPSGARYLDLNGQPDQAQLAPPSSYTASATSQGFWIEDELNFRRRLTLVPGVRFDHMRAASPDSPIVDGTSLVSNGSPWVHYYSFKETGGTIAGLGDLYTWNKVSPRLGVNLILTGDGKTVLRGTLGRYYRPLFLNDYLNVHPGNAATTLARFNPAVCAGATIATETPGCFTTIISVTDPRANIAVDSDTRAPWTNQYSIGIDREVMKNLSVSASVVHKKWGDQIGWVDIGGVYGTQTVTTPDGTMTVYPLMNATSARKYLRTNPPGFFNRYNGMLLQLTRRFTNGWMANAGYSYGVTRGLQPGGTLGQDPNDLVNLTGRQSPQDRPHLFNVSGMYEVPRIGVQFSGNPWMRSHSIGNRRRTRPSG